MTDNDREKLELQLLEVKNRVELLDMIEERLLLARQLALLAMNPELTKVEQEALNNQFTIIQSEINLLNHAMENFS
ncbi:hypothetical protein [Fusibacter ferrireducens]|uniref:Uncharacterized protein n=1 Tax=Fusibacter ferrireducens TaxID=2785058 RepID=A0ABR9ZX21_9FIRM|nr:hypothetical protein [Fusibacter ferrireducens]MBF4694501.1 hypothetical protein [Fusibacter ferrireducens]